MNILRFELNSLLRSFLVWTVSIICLYLVLMLGFFGMFMDGKDAVMSALSNLPPFFAAMFGMQLDTIFTFGGFFQFVFTYVGLAGAIMAATVSLHAFAREKRLKCGDFILTKPVRRGKIFLMKLLACLAVIVSANALLIIACVASWRIEGGGEPLRNLVLASSSLFFMQLVFLGIGALLSMLFKKVRSVSGTATAIGLAGFLAAALSALLKEDFLHYLSPFQYFSPGAVFLTGSYDAKLAWTGTLVAIGTTVFAYFLYVRRDAHAA